MQKTHFQALTGIRAIAAFMVFIVHFNPFTKERFGVAVNGFFEEFHVGISIFFVLSGFLIAYNYFDVPKLIFKQYLINRFARIFPMYFILTTLIFVFSAFFKNQNASINFWIYVSNITFTKSFFNDWKHTGIGQGWTLSIEELFYFTAPIIFLLIKKNRLFLFILPIFLMIFGFGIVTFCKSINFFGLMNSNAFMVEFTFFGRSFEFFVGIGLALIVQQKKQHFQRSYFTHFGICSIIILICFLSLTANENAASTDTFSGQIINYYLLPAFGIAPFFYGLISEKTLINKLLSSRLFILLGKSSYVFYLIHLGLLADFLYPIISNYLLFFVVLNLISIGLYWLIEKPLNKIIRQLSIR